MKTSPSRSLPITTPLKNQIPPNQHRTQRTTRPKHHPRRTLPLRRLLQLPIPTPHILSRRQRIRHELRDVSALHIQILH